MAAKKKNTQELEEKITELTNNWKRALADYQNLEKRYAKEKQEFLEFANSNLILKLLTALDNFEKVQGYLKDDGLDLAIKELKKILIEEGLDEIEAQGKEFNPLEMEAIEAVEGEEGKVVEVVTKGYRLKGKVLRPAKVKVGQVQKLAES